MKVLIVSSNPRSRAWVRGSLDPSWTIHEAADGNEAVKIVAAAAKADERAQLAAVRRGETSSRTDELFDLVIADESTEPFGAFGLAREVKDLEFAPRVLVLLDRVNDQWLAKWSGADRWLVRPVDGFVLGATARELAQIGISDEPADLLLGDPDEQVTESDVARMVYARDEE